VLPGLPEFEMFFPKTVDETCSLLSKYGRDAQVVAGGTDLFVKMKLRRFVPPILINIKKISGLDYIHWDEDRGLRIGPLTTIQAIWESDVVAGRFPVLREAAGVLGTEQIRNLGTLAGNLANASPSAEFAPPLLVLGASVRCLGRNGERRVPLERFFVGPGKTALEPDELIMEVAVANPRPDARLVYLKHSLRKMDVAMASAALSLVLDGGVCRDVRIALGAVAPTPFRAVQAERALEGKRLAADASESALLDEAAQTAAAETLPIDDVRSYASYRKKVIVMMVRHGLEHIIAQARTESPQ
jgi:aerobic carbon-monoxide dehydrogenase medium subunit